MHGIYSRRFVCLSYQVFMYVCDNNCPFIVFPFASTLGGGEVKLYFIIVEQNPTCHLVLLDRLVFAMLLSRSDINP